MAELVNVDASPFHQKMSLEKKKIHLLEGFPNSFYLIIFKNKRQTSQHGPGTGSSSPRVYSAQFVYMGVTPLIAPDTLLICPHASKYQIIHVITES